LLGFGRSLPKLEKLKNVMVLFRGKSSLVKHWKLHIMHDRVEILKLKASSTLWTNARLRDVIYRRSEYWSRKVELL